jgi:hypothetical protein
MQNACLPFGMIQDFRLFDKPHNISASRLFPVGGSVMTNPIFSQFFKGG